MRGILVWRARYARRLDNPSSGAPTAAANQRQVSVEAALAALEPTVWDFVTAEDRPGAVPGTGVDAVIRARRRSDGRPALAAARGVDASDVDLGRNAPPPPFEWLV